MACCITAPILPGRVWRTVLARFCKSLTLSIETEWLVMRVALADLAVSVRGKKLAKRRGAPGGLDTGDGRLANAGVSRWNVRNIRPTNSISTNRDRKSTRLNSSH